MRLHKQRALQTHRHAMLALDVSQINWRTTVAHLPTEDKWASRAVHEQATGQLCIEQVRHSATRRSGRLSGMIKRTNDTSASCAADLIFLRGVRDHAAQTAGRAGADRHIMACAAADLLPPSPAVASVCPWPLRVRNRSAGCPLRSAE